MSNADPATSRFPFVTQLPRYDGCGVAVLQMLTGKSYAELAAAIAWRDPAIHHMTWDLMRRALADSGMQFGAVREAKSWSDVEGVSVVHVQPDHFTLYDASTGEIYDPGKAEGPSREKTSVPLSFLPVY